MKTKSFLRTQSNALFLSRFHPHDFSFQRREDFVSTLNKLADVAVVDPGRIRHSGYILECDFRSVHNMWSLGCVRPGSRYRWNLSAKTELPQERHASETDQNETRFFHAKSSHANLLESLSFIQPYNCEVPHSRGASAPPIGFISAVT